MQARVPYWYGVRSSLPAAITLLEFKSFGPAGAQIDIGARVVDSSGLDVEGGRLTVTTATPGAKVVGPEATEGKPGVLSVGLVPAAGANVFNFTSGGITRKVTVDGN